MPTVAVQEINQIFPKMTIALKNYHLETMMFTKASAAYT